MNLTLPFGEKHTQHIPLFKCRDGTRGNIHGTQTNESQDNLYPRSFYWHLENEDFYFDGCLAGELGEKCPI
jgi:hypothetical protein